MLKLAKANLAKSNDAISALGLQRAADASERQLRFNIEVL